MAHRPANIVDVAVNCALTGLYAGTTIWYRMAMFGAASLVSDAARRAEAARMVNEKIGAGLESGLSASVAMMRAASAAARGRLSTSELPGAAATVLDASLQPAMKRARANSRRLRRGRKRR